MREGSEPDRDDRPTRGRRIQPSLRVQLAVVIALLSLLPNVVIAGLVLAPTLRETGMLEARIGTGLLAWAALVVAFSAGIGALLANVLLAPVTRIIRDADALPRTASRLVRARLPVATADPPEIVQLRDAIDRLLAQVQTEQARRSAFVATLMHDMKTPLLAQANALRLLRDGADSVAEEEWRDLLGRALTESEALAGMVQQLVDAHRFEQGEVRPRRVPCDLAALLQQEVERHRSAAHARGVRLSASGAADAEVDPDLIARAVGNLVANALRYARSEVRVEALPGLIRIQDDGPGLPAPLESLARPFNDQPQVGSDASASRFRKGSGGLGLYVASSILRAHGGRLVTEATGPGGTVLLAYLGDGSTP